MELEKKIKLICNKVGVSTRKDLANLLGLNEVVFARNVRENKLTGDMILAIAECTNVDMNWLLREKNGNEDKEIDLNSSETNTIEITKINNIIKELENLKSELTRK